MAGNYLKGSEKLWEAASHAMTEAAIRRSWPYSDHRELHMAAKRLSDETGDASIAAGLSVADMFRANSRLDFMEEYQVDEDRRVVKAFVERVLELA